MTTPSQTIGPFWHTLAEPSLENPIVMEGSPTITLIGHVTDGDGAPVTDACVELWQSSPAPGFGRCATDPEGRFRFVTAKPGPVPGQGNHTQAPHVALTVFARGLLAQVVTRAYFAGEALNDTDPVLQSIDPARRATLIAQPDGDQWRMDIRLQGDGETVFLDV